MLYTRLMPASSVSELRRWARLRQAGAERERALRRRDQPPSAAQAIAHGFGLIDFAGALLGWPVPEDEVSARQAEETRRIWRRLRERLARP
jgi:hypothetical protein